MCQNLPPSYDDDEEGVVGDGEGDGDGDGDGVNLSSTFPVQL